MSDPGTGPEIDREPDYRFTLANERTFLAWIRTSFGLLAGGVAVNELAALFGTPFWRAAVSFTLLGTAAVLSGGAYRRWRALQMAMRADAPLPRTRLIPLLALVTCAVTVVAIALLALT